MGRPDVDVMLEEITWEQFCGWIAYNQIEPFGDRRGDLRSAISTSSIVNILIQAHTAKGRPKLTRPQDFMPKFDRATAATDRKALTDPEAWKQMVSDLKARVAVIAGGDSRQAG